MPEPRSDGARTTPAAGRFAGACAAAVARLPFGLSRLVPPTLLGFAVVNGATFGLDLLLLTIVHGWWRWPVPVAITIGYAVAFSVSFVLNRRFTFRSHAPVGRQTLLYALAIAVNFGAVLLGVGSGLAALGVQYQVARLVAGLCEGVFLYCALRWVVFRGPR